MKKVQLTRDKLHRILENDILSKRIERTKPLKHFLKETRTTAKKLNNVPSVNYMLRISMPRVSRSEIRKHSSKRRVLRDGTVSGTFRIPRDQLGENGRSQGRGKSVILKTRIIYVKSEAEALRRAEREFKKFKRGRADSIAMNIQKYSGKLSRRGSIAYKEGRIQGGTAKALHINAIKRKDGFKKLNDAMVEKFKEIHQQVFTLYMAWHKKQGGRKKGLKVRTTVMRLKELLELYEEEEL